MTAAVREPHDEFQHDAVDLFHRRVARLFTVAGAKPPNNLVDALEARMLLPWAHYTEMLFELDIPLAERRQLKSAWTPLLELVRAERLAQVAKATPHSGIYMAPAPPPSDTHIITSKGEFLPEPARAQTVRVRTSALHGTLRSRFHGVEQDATVQAIRSMRETELQARTPQEFTELLRTIQMRSGLNPGEIAKRTGIPRSQAYAMVKRGVLPTKIEQVKAFLGVCGLPQHQADHVLRLWNELHEREARKQQDDKCVTTFLRAAADQQDLDVDIMSILGRRDPQAAAWHHTLLVTAFSQKYPDETKLPACRLATKLMRSKESCAWDVNPADEPPTGPAEVCADVVVLHHMDDDDDDPPAVVAALR